MRRYDVGSAPDFSVGCESFQLTLKVAGFMISEISNVTERVGPVDESRKDNVIEEKGIRYFSGISVSNKLRNSVMFTSNVAEIYTLEGCIFTPWLSQFKFFFKSDLVAFLDPIQQEFRPCQRSKLSSIE